MKVRHEFSFRNRGTFFPLSSGHTGMVGMRTSCMSFFLTNVALIGHMMNK